MKKEFTVRQMQLSDLETVNDVTMRSWLDVYVNSELGITEDWIRKFWRGRGRGKEARDNLEWRLKHDKINFLVGVDESGIVVARCSQIVLPNGSQEITTLYVDKEYYGSGLADSLMKRMIDWFDGDEPIVLGVTTFNERAKRFYKKWGFKEIEGSESLKFDKLPEIQMIKEGDK